MKKHYVLPNNVHETETGMPEYCMFYDAADVDARIADLELAAKENARYSTEMREEFERRGERIAELVKALQLIYSLTDSGMRDGDEARAIAKRALMER